MKLQRHVDFNVNYDDQRFQNVNNEKNEKLSEVNQLYDGMIQQSDNFYNQQSELAKNYEQTQNQLAQNNYNQTLNEINQQQEQTKKDYEKEQKGNYTDYQKAINQYGVQAENMASAGIDNSGYSESSKIMAFNAYNNRLSTARESYNTALMNYNNKKLEAKNNLDVTLAQNAYTSLQAQLESALQGFQYKNTLLTEQLNQKQNIDNTYYGRWQDVLNQINQENQMNYQKEIDERNYNYQKEIDERDYNFQREQFEYQKQQDAISNALAAQKASSTTNNKKNTTGNYKDSGWQEVIDDVTNSLKDPQIGPIASTELKTKKANSYIDKALNKGKITQTEADEIRKAYGL